MKHALLVLVSLTTIAHAAPKPAAHYAKLFDPKATWTYEVTTGTAPAITVTCKVARVASFKRMIASEITCDGGGDNFPLAGVYLATSSGLYLSGDAFPESPPTERDMVFHQLLIAARPTATSKSTTRYAVVDDKAFAVKTTWGARRDPFGERSPKQKVWCWYRTTERDTDKHTDTRCFDGAIVSGAEADQTFRVR